MRQRQSQVFLFYTDILRDIYLVWSKVPDSCDTILYSKLCYFLRFRSRHCQRSDRDVICRAVSLEVADRIYFFAEYFSAVLIRIIIKTSDYLQTEFKKAVISKQGLPQPSSTYYYDRIGYNSRLDELQAGLLRVRLSHMAELTEEKRKIAARYDAELTNPKIRLPKLAPGATGVWHQYVIRCEERNRLMGFLNERGIGTIIHYPIPPHLAEAYRYLGHQAGDFPITEHLAETVLSIPMYNGMTEDEQKTVIDAINQFE